MATATALWYHTGLPPVPLRWVLICDPKEKFELQALLCTDLAAEPARILSWFVLGWKMEVTFQEARRHLGVETQRQWSELAIRRTIPALLALFSLVTLLAHRRMARSTQPRGQRGTANPTRRSPMLWRWCDGSCGQRRLFAGQPEKRTW